MDAPTHCPGLQAHKSLSSYTCKCSNCGKEKEIFSDEFDRSHMCPRCNEPLDLTLCTPEAASHTLK